MTTRKPPPVAPSSGPKDQVIVMQLVIDPDVIVAARREANLKRSEDAKLPEEAKKILADGYRRDPQAKHKTALSWLRNDPVAGPLVEKMLQGETEANFLKKIGEFRKSCG